VDLALMRWWRSFHLVRVRLLTAAAQEAEYAVLDAILARSDADALAGKR
jgi:hypothetical protein